MPHPPLETSSSRETSREDAVPASVPTPVRSASHPPTIRTVVLIAAATFVLGGGVGAWVGRSTLERTWSSPFETVSPDRATQAAASGADPTPTAGSKVLKPMPLARTRMTLDGMTKPDPAMISTGTVGRDSAEFSLDMMIKNRGSCDIVAASGVAYGFDAWNQPSTMNKSGEHYVSFSVDKVKIAPGKTSKVSIPLHFPETASIVVGHVDKITCASGSSWVRPPAP